MLPVASGAIALFLGTFTPGATAAETLHQDSPAVAAPASESEEIRRRVKVGQEVEITDDGGRHLKGRIRAIGPDVISVDSQADVTELAYERIVRIDRPHDGLGNGALWGLASGAVVGFAMVVGEEAADCDPGVYFSCGDPHPAAYAVVPAIIGGLGAAIGVAVDALVRREPSIYRRGGLGSVRVVPTLGPGVAGATLSMSW